MPMNFGLGHPGPPAKKPSRRRRLAPVQKFFGRGELIPGTMQPRRARECWEARTLDGLWHMQRLDAPGTPWELTHLPTERSMPCSSLHQAREMIADGSALRQLDLLEAQP